MKMINAIDFEKMPGRKSFLSPKTEIFDGGLNQQIQMNGLTVIDIKQTKSNI